MIAFKALIFISLAVAYVHCDYINHGDAEHGYGYSYAKFNGPVSGPSKEVHYTDGHHHVVDFVSKPDYQFEYGVEDPHSHVKQSRKEVRDGDTVTGEYTVAQADGKLRLVKYTADPHHGFQAQVFIDGKPLYEEQPQPKAHHQSHSYENSDEGQRDDGSYEESNEY